MPTSIICITCNHLPYTKLCIESVLKHSKDFELIIVDNGSTDGTPDYIKSLGVKYHLFSGNMGCAVAKNEGIRLSEPNNDILILDNDNIIATPDWLQILLKEDGDMVHPYVFVSSETGCTDKVINRDFYHKYMSLRQKSLQEDDTDTLKDVVKQTYGDTLEGFAAEFVKRRPQPGPPWPGCFLVRRYVLNKIGLYDEGFGKCAWYDVDFAKRAYRAGFRSIVTNKVFLHHFGSVTTRKSGLSGDTKMREEEIKSGEYFKKKWGGTAQKDHLNNYTVLSVEQYEPRIKNISGFLSTQEQNKLFELSRATSGVRLELGGLVGLSSCCLALGMGCSDLLITVDKFEAAGVHGATRKLIDGIQSNRPSFFNLWHHSIRTLCPNKNIIGLIGHYADKLQSVRAVLGPRQIALLFVDMDHGHESTEYVLHNYLPLLADSGLLVFHDHNAKHFPEQFNLIQAAIKANSLIESEIVHSLLILQKA